MNEPVNITLSRVHAEWLEGTLRAQAKGETHAVVPMLGFDEDDERQSVKIMADTFEEALREAGYRS